MNFGASILTLSVMARWNNHANSRMIDFQAQYSLNFARIYPRSRRRVKTVKKIRLGSQYAWIVRKADRTVDLVVVAMEPWAKFGPYTDTTVYPTLVAHCNIILLIIEVAITETECRMPIQPSGLHA